jgi:membrane protein required for colicin V production
MMSMSILDWIFVLIILFSVLQAISSGFVREFFAFVGVIVAYLTAVWEYPKVATFYARFMNTPWPAQIAAFFTVFIVVVVLVGIVGCALSRLVRGIGLSWFDRLFGAVFGFFRGVVVSAIIALGLVALAPHWGLSQSKTAPYMLAAGRTMIWAAPAEFRERFWEGWNLLRTVPDHIPIKVQQDESSQHNSTP